MRGQYNVVHITCLCFLTLCVAEETLDYMYGFKREEIPLLHLNMSVENTYAPF